MAIEIIMPKQGNTVESCLILDWRVALGDKVSKGDVICEIETDKSTLEIEAEEEGTVLHLYYNISDDVPVLSPILILGEPGEDISQYVVKGTKEELPPPSTRPTRSEPTPPIKAHETLPNSIKFADRTNSPFIAASPRARKAATEKAVDLRQIQGSGPGGRILEQDVRSFADMFSVVGPAARAEGWHTGHAGTGVGGRLQGGERPTQPSLPLKSTEGAERSGAIKEITLSRMRKIIASRMMQSLQSTAQYSLNTSAPAASLQHWRKHFKQSNDFPELQGITLGDMLLFAVSRVLPRFPELNAEFKDRIIYQYSDVHLGFAVDTPRGLMVPIIHNSHTKSLKQISDESKALARSCLEGTTTPDDMSGATFTVSNLGSLGIESFTPLINLPQVAILGIGSIQLKPMLQNGEVIFESHIGLSMTIDHQVVDGAPAARFLKEFRDFVGDFTPHDRSEQDGD